MCPPKFSEKFAADISKRQAASGNSNWKGDKVGYDALHAWIKRHKTKAKMCNDCGLVPPYDLANISQEYKRDLLDWEWLCRKCHMAKDGRLEAFKKMRVGKVARSN